jgi:hypothetical protein
MARLAARDFAESAPEFAVEAGLLAINGFASGCGYEVTGMDVLVAHVGTMKAAARLGRAADISRRIGDMMR